MKRQNKQKGITLIALVITIIVLLILAGITINLTIGQDGIITKAQQAGKNYVNAANYENQMLKDFESMTDDILTNVTGQNGGTSTPSAPTEIKVENITLDKIRVAMTLEESMILTATVSPSNATNKDLTWSSSDESIATVSNGKIVPIKEGKTIITATAQDESTKTANCELYVTHTLASVAKEGEYVKYDTGVPNVGENGIVMCRILYDAKSENGLQIVANQSIAKFGLYGSYAYNNLITILNDETKKYENVKYVKESRCIGSNPKNKNEQASSNVTLMYVPTGWTTSDTEYKELDNNYQSDYDKMEELNICNIGEVYWIASRTYHTTSSFCRFDAKIITKDGILKGCGELNYGGGLFFIDADGLLHEYTSTYGLRPCFSIRDNVKVISGDGSNSENAYMLLI